MGVMSGGQWFVGLQNKWLKIVAQLLGETSHKSCEKGSEMWNKHVAGPRAGQCCKWLAKRVINLTEFFFLYLTIFTVFSIVFFRRWHCFVETRRTCHLCGKYPSKKRLQTDFGGSQFLTDYWCWRYRFRYDTDTQQNTLPQIRDTSVEIWVFCFEIMNQQHPWPY